jgi:hypothetical protein
MTDYNLPYTGVEISDGLARVVSPDTTPTNASTKAVTSGGVKTYVDTSLSGLLLANDFSPATVGVGQESVTLPNGLIMKFGTVTGVTTQTSLDITFGTAFTNEILCVQLTSTNATGNSSANADFWYQIKDQSQTDKITIYHQQASASTSISHTVNWLVIGR